MLKSRLPTKNDINVSSYGIKSTLAQVINSIIFKSMYSLKNRFQDDQFSAIFDTCIRSLQIVALMATYIFTLKVGIDMMTPTIIIGALADKRSVEHNFLSDISKEQMTWIGELDSYLWCFTPWLEV